MTYEGNRRFVSNPDQSRCNCGLFVQKGQPENGILRYHCDRCGPRLEYVRK